MPEQPKRRSSEDLIREAKRSLEPDPQPDAPPPPETSETDHSATSPIEPYESPGSRYTAASAPIDSQTDPPAAVRQPAPSTPPPSPTPPETRPGVDTQRHTPDERSRVVPPPQRTSQLGAGERMLVSVPVQATDNRIVAAIVPFLIGLGIATFFALSAGGIGAGLIIGVFLVASLTRLFRRLAAARGAAAADTPTQITVTTDRIVLSSDGQAGPSDTVRSLDGLREWEIGGGRMPSIELEFDDGTDVTFLLTSGDAAALTRALRTVAPDAED